MINNLYFRNEVDGSSNLLAINDVTDAVAVWYNNNIINILSEDVVGTVARGVDMSTNPGLEVELTYNVSGGVASEAAPNNVAAVPSFRTGVGGRSFRGRNYISGVPNSQILINVLDNGFVANVITAYMQLLAGGGVLPANWEWVVVSMFSAGAQRPVGLTTPVQNVIFTDTIVDSQRRRLPGRGK